MPAISQQGGRFDVFVSKTANGESIEYNFAGGLLQVNLDGVLDGADVETLYKTPVTPLTQVRVLSWLTSDLDTLVDPSGGVAELTMPSIIVFKISNAGTSTSINLSAFPLTEKN